MIVHICDQCGGDIGNLLITAAQKNQPTRDFCVITCLSEWAETENQEATGL